MFEYIMILTCKRSTKQCNNNKHMLEPEHHSACYAGNAPSSLFHSENQACFVRRHFYDKRHFTATTRREHVKHFTKKAA